MARTQALPLVGTMTNRDSTSCRNDSRLTSSRIRPLLASVANSSKLISQIAKPFAFLRASSMAALARAEICFWSNASRDYLVSIHQNHFRSPHSSAEIAGETTSPVMAPLPAIKL
jgi:hypothetical protein